MRSLIGFEWKKHFWIPVIWILTPVFLILNLLLIVQNYNQHLVAEWQEAYEELYQKYSGQITEEKTEELFLIYSELCLETANMEAVTGEDPDSFTYNKYSDVRFLELYFINEMKYDSSYEDYANEIVKHARENVDFFQEKENSFEVEKNKKIAVAFRNRKITEFYSTKGYNYYFNYDFSSLLILFLVILGVSSVFVKEQETEMCHMLVTSRRGGIPTLTAKLVSTWLFAVAVSLLFYGEDYFLYMQLYGGWDAGSSPLYAIRTFEGTPLLISIFQSALLFLGIRILGILVIATLLLMVSMQMKRALPTVVINLIAVLLLILLAARIFGYGKLFNPIMLIQCRSLFYEMDYLNMFGIPVPIWAVSIGFSGFLLIMCAAGILFLKRKGKRNVLV